MLPVIEPFTADKLEETQRFLRVALRDDVYSLDLWTRDSDLQDIAAHYQRDGGQFWLLLAGADKSVVGCIGLERVNEDTLELRRFVVDEPLRNHGFGERLLVTAMNHALHADCKRIRLHIPGKTQAALHLLRKHRFHEIRRFNTDPRSVYFFEHWIQENPAATAH
ncbi:MAG: hypothetical protein RLZZ385_2157 [Pseudomonadota bacterium]|jgi:putative acetyltransferase